eukprot:SAG11_NODE_10170_length_850_cov_0.950732_3_plen_53_part_01
MRGGLWHRLPHRQRLVFRLVFLKINPVFFKHPIFIFKQFRMKDRWKPKYPLYL